MVLNDVYYPHTHAELEALVAAGNLDPEAFATLDPEEVYGIQWYNRNKYETDSNGKRVPRPRPRDEWIAIPTPDAGVPREHGGAARAAIKDNVRPSDAGRRFWNLKGLAYCPCGGRLTPHTIYNKRSAKPLFYYCCYTRRSDRDACPYVKYLPAEKLEHLVEAFVLDLIRNPETLREQVEAEAAREKAAMRNTRKQVASLAHRLAEADAERDRYNRLYARGKLSDDEYDAYTAELAERKQAAEDDLAKFEDGKRTIEYLDELPRLVEDFLRELPEMVEYMPRIRGYTTDEDRKKVYASYPPTELTPEVVVPGMHRKRTPEEMAELHHKAANERAECYRELYEKLNLHVIAYPNRDLEISWFGGVRKLEGTA